MRVEPDLAVAEPLEELPVSRQVESHAQSHPVAAGGDCERLDLGDEARSEAAAPERGEDARRPR
jgi:hypothetical protein